jgi:hypothetical protein
MLGTEAMEAGASLSGRGAFRSRAKRSARAAVDEAEVRMPV